MKKILSICGIAAVAVLSLASCNKDIDSPSVPVQKVQKSEVTLNIADYASSTKAVQTESEAKVNSIQVFIFNGDNLDVYHNASADEITSGVVTMQGTVGTRDIYVLVNAPDLSSYVSKTALLAKESLLADNAQSGDSFVMGGSIVDANVIADYSATISVKRFVARIQLLKVTRNFENASLQSLPFEIQKFYVANAATNRPYSFGEPSAYIWNNKVGVDGGALKTGDVFLYEKPATAISIANGASDETAHVFYAYANADEGDASADPAVEAVKTRLVVEAKVGENYYTYPIEMPSFDPNKSYKIVELVLTRLGNNSNGDDTIDDDEDEPIEFASAELTIQVEDWTEVLVGDTDGVVTI